MNGEDAIAFGNFQDMLVTKKDDLSSRHESQLLVLNGKIPVLTMFVVRVFS